MGNDINNFCNCKEISDAFNPDLEDVFIIIILIKNPKKL